MSACVCVCVEGGGGSFGLYHGFPNRLHIKDEALASKQLLVNLLLFISESVLIKTELLLWQYIVSQYDVHHLGRHLGWF